MKKKTKTSESQRRATDKYNSANLKRVWISKELAEVLTSGMYGSTVLESSRNIADTLKRVKPA